MDENELWSTAEAGEDRRARVSALGALEGLLAPDDWRAHERLEALVSRPEKVVGGAASRVLMRLRRKAAQIASDAGGGEDGEATAVIASEKDPIVLRNLAEAAVENQNFAAAPVLEKLVREGLSDDLLGPFAAALGALGDESVLPLLKKLSRHKATEVRKGAVEGLSYQSGPERTRLLVERLADQEKSVQADALARLLETPPAEVVKIIASIPAGKATSIRRGSVAYLARIRDAGSMKLILRFLDDPELILAAEALVTLARLGRPEAQQRIQALSKHTDPKVQKIVQMAASAYQAKTGVDPLAKGALQAPSEPAPGSTDPPPPSVDDDFEQVEAGDAELAAIFGAAVGKPVPPEPISGVIPREAVGQALDHLASSTPDAAGDVATRDTVVGPSAPPPAAAAESGSAPVPRPEPAPDPAPAPDASAAAANSNPWESIGGAASAPPPASDNPWETIGGGASSAEDAAQGLLGGLDAPAPAPDDLEEEPAPRPAPVRDKEAEDAAAQAQTAATVAELASQERRTNFRRLLASILVTGVCITAWWANRYYTALKRVDERQRRLDIETRELASAVTRFEEQRRTPYRKTDFADLVPKWIPTVPKDPFGRAYEYDPVLRRVFSTGKDGIQDRGARLDAVGSLPDDHVVFARKDPEVMAVTFRDGAAYHVATILPGTAEAELWKFPGVNHPPLNPVMLPGGSRIAYLFADPDTGLLRAEWRRAVPGLDAAWDTPQPVLPDHWSCESIVWVPDGSGLVTIAAGPGQGPALHLVSLTEAGARVQRLAPDLVAPRDPAVSPDGTRIAVSAQVDGIRRIVSVPITANEHEDPLDRDRILGPPGSEPTWGPRGRSIWFCGKDPQNPAQNALLSWSPHPERPTEARARYTDSEELHVPVISVSDRRVAVARGKSILVLLPGQGEVEVFQAPGTITRISWPFYWKMARQ